MQERSGPVRVHVEREGRSWLGYFIELLITVLFVGASILALVNVFGSSIEVDRLAGETACMGQGKACEAMPIKWEKVPWAHTMQVSTTGGTIDVRCSREYVLLGTWSCHALNALPERPAPSESATALPVASAPPKALPKRAVTPRVKVVVPVPAPSASGAPSSASSGAPEAARVDGPERNE